MAHACFFSVHRSSRESQTKQSTGNLIDSHVKEKKNLIHSDPSRSFSLLCSPSQLLRPFPTLSSTRTPNPSFHWPARRGAAPWIGSSAPSISWAARSGAAPSGRYTSVRSLSLHSPISFSRGSITLMDGSYGVRWLLSAATHVDTYEIVAVKIVSS